MSFIEKETPCGTVKGIDGERCVEYRGIRYATAKRYERPEIVTHWDGTYDATEFGACCFQHRAFEDDATVNPFYHKEFRKGIKFKYSEDCQFLNIWAPKDARDCPVLIFIHGGTFTGGSADEGHINGTRFAEKGVIVVAMNYRIGPYGFCAHEDLKDENGYLANFGLYDQTAAIKWVIRNIASLGGDPKRITLMGQSAGAISVDIHLNNPELKGKLAGAVMISGAGLHRCIMKPNTVKGVTPFWNKVMEKAGAKTIDDLKRLDSKELYYAWLNSGSMARRNMPNTFPVYDGNILKKEEFNLKHIPDIPQMISSTCTDMIPIALQYTLKKWGRYMKNNASSPCYIYNFNRFLPGDNMGAWHTADLLYVFNTLDFNWRPFEEIDYKISEQLSDSIAAFAKNGNPDCDSIPHWTPDYKKPMSFCENTAPAPWKTWKNLLYTITNKGKTV